MIRKWTVLAVLLCISGAADAVGPLRCQGRIIDTGAAMAAVSQLCGAPASRSSRNVAVRSVTTHGFSRVVGVASTEQWVYDRGWGRFPAVLTFDAGRIVRIDYLQYRSGTK